MPYHHGDPGVGGGVGGGLLGGGGVVGGGSLAETGFTHMIYAVLGCLLIVGGLLVLRLASVAWPRLVGEKVPSDEPARR